MYWEEVDKIPEVMCPSPSRASELHETMTEKYRIWRNTDLSQRQDIRKHHAILFQMEQIQI